MRGINYIIFSGGIIMRNFNRIPDFTERYPEGEVSTITSSNKEEKIMMKYITMNELNKTLEAKGIVYDSPDIPDEYEQSARLEAIYDWGFTVVTYCNVLDPVITFYDNQFQAILSLDIDSDTSYSLCNGVLRVEERNCFGGVTRRFYVNLSSGAPVHTSDIVAIGYADNDMFDDKRFYALKDGRIYYKEDGAELKLIKDNVDVIDFMDAGYTLVSKDSFGSNVDILNNMIVRM
jgi:hypothetical protein